MQHHSGLMQLALPCKTTRNHFEFWGMTLPSLRKEFRKIGQPSLTRCAILPTRSGAALARFRAVFFLRIAWSLANSGTRPACLARPAPSSGIFRNWSGRRYGQARPVLNPPKQLADAPPIAEVLEFWTPRPRPMPSRQCGSHVFSQPTINPRGGELSTTTCQQSKGTVRLWPLASQASTFAPFPPAGRPLSRHGGKWTLTGTLT